MWKRPFSVLYVRALVGAFNFQLGEGPSRGLLRDCENCENRLYDGSGHNSASFQWEEHLIVHRLLIKSSADIPEWPGVTRALFPFCFGLRWRYLPYMDIDKPQQIKVSQDIKGILSWFPSKIKSVINLIDCKRFHLTLSRSGKHH